MEMQVCLRRAFAAEGALPRLLLEQKLHLEQMGYRLCSPSVAARPPSSKSSSRNPSHARD